MKNEIFIYQANKLSTRLEVRVGNESVWLNRQQIALLFERDIKTIGKHIRNVLIEELKGLSVVSKYTLGFYSSKFEGIKNQKDLYGEIYAN